MLPKITDLISQMSQNGLYLKVLKQAHKKYTVSLNDLKTLSPYQVLHLLKKFNNQTDFDWDNSAQQSEQPSDGFEQNWHPCEYKLFSWMSVCYAYFLNIEINQFGKENICYLHRIFNKKRQIFIEYNLLCLQKQPKTKKDEWTAEQREYLLALTQDQRFKSKWIDISYQLFCKTDKNCFRNSHSCREMWINHLNPVVNHSKWTPEEDLELYKFAASIGQKWALISKAVQGVRTEHMVKNRFKAIWKKYHNRFQRCSVKRTTELIRNLLQKNMIKNEPQVSMQEKDNGIESQQNPSDCKNGSIIEEEEDQDDEDDEQKEVEQEKQVKIDIQQQVKEEYLSQERVFLKQIDNEKAEQQQQELKVEQQACIRKLEQKEGRKGGVYQADYENIKEDNIDYQGSLADWVQAGHHKNVQLVDYTDFYPQFKQTIFSGTNS